MGGVYCLSCETGRVLVDRGALRNSFCAGAVCRTGSAIDSPQVDFLLVLGLDLPSTWDNTKKPPKNPKKTKKERKKKRAMDRILGSWCSQRKAVSGRFQRIQSTGFFLVVVVCAFVFKAHTLTARAGKNLYLVVIPFHKWRNWDPDGSAAHLWLAAQRVRSRAGWNQTPGSLWLRRNMDLCGPRGMEWPPHRLLFFLGCFWNDRIWNCRSEICCSSLSPI